MLLCCLFRQALNNIIGCAASSGPDALGQKNTHIHFNQGRDGTLGFAMLCPLGPVQIAWGKWVKKAAYSMAAALFVQ